MIPGIKAAALFLTIGVVAVGVAWLRSREQAETTRKLARVRGQARARAAAGMPPGHPENPAPPGLLEVIAYGAEHEWIAAQLAGIEAGIENGDLL